MSPLDDLIRTVDCIGKENDCGDNSCSFVEPSDRGGMRTNGGCRCMDRDKHLLKSRLRQLLYHARALRDGLRDAERLRADIEDGEGESNG